MNRPPDKPPKVRPIDTPLRRRRIEQLVGNELPGHVVVFLTDNPRELVFQIRKRDGRFLPGTIRLRAHHKRVRLNREWLKRQLDQLPRAGK